MLEVVVKKSSKYRVLYHTPRNVRYILLYGPRASGKSFQASRAAIVHMTSKPYFRGFMMRNILDTVRDSVFQDCVDRISELSLPLQVVESNLLIRHGENELKGRGFKKSSGSDTAKNKSLAGRNFVLIEEAEELDADDFYQLDLSLRTVKGQVTVVLVFNPPQKGHWILRDWFNLTPDPDYPEFFHMAPRTDRKDTAYIFSNYKDNLKHLDPNVVQRMERFKETDLEYYLHKIVGLVPSGKTGRVFKQYSTISSQDFDKLAYSSLYGLDFGYSADPAACVEVKRHNNKLYIRERLYDTGLTNPALYERLKWITSEITADSAEQKSIQELSDLGLFIKGAAKGSDSVRNGIQRIQQHEIYICEDSRNVMAEFENYTWKLDKNKEPTDIPIDKHNHAIDALRYALEDEFTGRYDFSAF